MKNWSGYTELESGNDSVMMIISLPVGPSFTFRIHYIEILKCLHGEKRAGQYHDYVTRHDLFTHTGHGQLLRQLNTPWVLFVYTAHHERVNYANTNLNSTAQLEEKFLGN